MVPPIRITVASEGDREAIYRMRHDIYARELGQHSENDSGTIRDSLDDANTYLIAFAGGTVAGFVSITPPDLGRYSIDRYLRREQIPFPLDAQTYEVRLLSVLPRHRGSLIPALLMYAAFRWIEAHGGTRVVALGRREVRSVYIKAGLRPSGDEFAAGAVTFVLMTGEVGSIREGLRSSEALLARLERQCRWDLVIPFHKPAECFHGGAFFNAVGDEFDRLDRGWSIINADVLDAWFPPSPRVLNALHDYLPWLLRTSPPTGCEGFVRTIARRRGIAPESVLPGAGSSALIFLALREWLTSSSRVLLPDPTYGEYGHILEKVIRCRVDRLVLSRKSSYDIDLARLRGPYDLIVLVNPNSPTGRHIPRSELVPFLRQVPQATLVWIDETYVDYTGGDQSLEQFAVTRPNIVVCKSMSKVYALSGARAAYLCASPHLLERLRAITPPWAVSLPAQVAAVEALNDEDYYTARIRETAVLRAHLTRALRSAVPLDVTPGTANFLLGHLQEEGPVAAEIVARCRVAGLFIRDASTMGSDLGAHAIRIAVKDRATIDRMAEILGRVYKEAAEHHFTPLRSSCM